MIGSYTKYKYLLTVMNCLLKNEYKAIAVCKTDDEINELRAYIVTGKQYIVTGKQIGRAHV